MLKINYNIIPEDIIRQFKRDRPRIIGANIFESVTAELLAKNRELQQLLDVAEDEIEELKDEVQESLSSAELEDTNLGLEDRVQELERNEIKLKKDFAQYLSDHTEIMEEMQGYFDENLEELIDEYRL